MGKVFTLRLTDERLDKLEILAKNEHRSTTNYIEYILLKHLVKIEKECGPVKAQPYLDLFE